MAIKDGMPMKTAKLKSLFFMVFTIFMFYFTIV